MPTPTPKDYRDFHKTMGSAPEGHSFSQRYKELYSIKMIRGQSTGKTKQMQEMVKLWSRAKNEAITQAVPVWQTTTIEQHAYSDDAKQVALRLEPNKLKE